MSSTDRVRSYFDREAQRFDVIYESRKPWYQRLVDRNRRVVVERWKLICVLAPAGGGWTALDVGCGSGRYAIAFARLGAAQVVGVDVAPSMIDLATRQAEAAGVAGRTRFVTGSFLEFDTGETFDLVVASGYLDYLRDPVAHLRKMAALARGHVYVTVPKRRDVRVPLRKLRFALARGFVRFYDREEFLSIARQAGIAREQVAMIDLGRDWVAAIRIASPGSAGQRPGP